MYYVNKISEDTNLKVGNSVVIATAVSDL